MSSFLNCLLGLTNLSNDVVIFVILGRMISSLIGIYTNFGSSQLPHVQNFNLEKKSPVI